MVINAIDSLDVSRIYPGYTVKFKIVNESMVSSLIETAGKLGCKLISLNYGEFYFKEFISERRNQTIDDILSDL